MNEFGDQWSHSPNNGSDDVVWTTIPFDYNSNMLNRENYAYGSIHGRFIIICGGNFDVIKGTPGESDFVANTYDSDQAFLMDTLTMQTYHLPKLPFHGPCKGICFENYFYVVSTNYSSGFNNHLVKLTLHYQAIIDFMNEYYDANWDDQDDQDKFYESFDMTWEYIPNYTFSENVLSIGTNNRDIIIFTKKETYALDKNHQLTERNLIYFNNSAEIHQNMPIETIKGTEYIFFIQYPHEDSRDIRYSRPFGELQHLYMNGLENNYNENRIELNKNHQGQGNIFVFVYSKWILLICHKNDNRPQRPMSLYNIQTKAWETTKRIIRTEDNCLKVGHYLYNLGSYKSKFIKRVRLNQLIDDYESEAIKEYDEIRYIFQKRFKGGNREELDRFIQEEEEWLNNWNDEDYKLLYRNLLYVFCECNDDVYAVIREFIMMYLSCLT